MKYKKYKPGDKIKTLDELYKQDFIFCRAKLYHCGWFLSWSLRDCKNYLIQEDLLKAVKTDCESKIIELQPRRKGK